MRIVCITILTIRITLFSLLAHVSGQGILYVVCGMSVFVLSCVQ